MSDLATACFIASPGPRHTGLGLVDSPSEILAAIGPQLKELITVQAGQAGQQGADAARSAVIKYSLIAAGVGIVGGGLLGLALSKKFR